MSTAIDIICDEHTMNTFLKKLQNKQTNNQFVLKNPHDHIKCIICGGSYTRQAKSLHYKTKKHQKSTNLFYEKFNE